MIKKTILGALLLVGVFACRWFTPAEKPAPSVVVVESEPQPIDEGSAGFGGNMIDAARDRAIAKAGTSWPEIQSWVVKIRNVFGVMKASEIAEAVEKQPAESTSEPPPKPKLYFFTASWCGPCQSIKAKMAKRNFADFDVVTVDVDQRSADRSLMKGNTIPQLVIVDGKKTWRFVGPSKIAGWLK